MVAVPFSASWGWRPTVAHTPVCALATSTAAADQDASVPTTINRVTPAWRAGSIASAATWQ